MATVTVKARQLHSYDGKEYKVGDVYEIDANDLELFYVQGKVESVEENARRALFILAAQEKGFIKWQPSQ